MNSPLGFDGEFDVSLDLGFDIRFDTDLNFRRCCYQLCFIDTSEGIYSKLGTHAKIEGVCDSVRLTFQQTCQHEFGRTHLFRLKHVKLTIVEDFLIES